MGTVVRFVLSLIVTAVCAWPVLLYVAADKVLDPSGFWQNFLLLGVGLWFLFGSQIVFLVLLVIALFAIWTIET